MLLETVSRKLKATMEKRIASRYDKEQNSHRRISAAHHAENSEASRRFEVEEMFEESSDEGNNNERPSCTEENINQIIDELSSDKSRHKISSNREVFVRIPNFKNTKEIRTLNNRQVHGNSVERPIRDKHQLHMISDDCSIDEIEVFRSDSRQDDNQPNVGEQNALEKQNSRKENVSMNRHSDTAEDEQALPYFCWICLKEFSLKLNVKKHSFRSHSKAFCVAAQVKDDSQQPVLFFFCPRDCDHVTPNLESLKQHVSQCQQQKVQAKGMKTRFTDIQNNFLKQEYIGMLLKAVSWKIKKVMAERTSSRLNKEHNTHMNSNVDEADKVTKRYKMIIQRLTGEVDIYQGVQMEKDLNDTNNISHEEVQQNMQTEEGPFLCAECGKIFECLSDFNSHVKLHAEEEQVACLYDWYPFKFDEVQQKIQTEQKPYLCPECGKMFVCLADLDGHIKMHAEEKSFTCLCGNHLSFLNNCLNTHTNGISFLCDDWERVFRGCVEQFSHAKDYLNTYTKDISFQYGECGKEIVYIM